MARLFQVTGPLFSLGGGLVPPDGGLVSFGGGLVSVTLEKFLTNTFDICCILIGWKRKIS